MPNKFARQHLAPGYWGSPWRYITDKQVPAQVRVMLQDKLIARGRWVDLYTPVSAATPGVVACTCVKNTTDSADRGCLTCYGTKFAPGYTKFLRQTQFWCSAESSSFALTNVVVQTAKKANVLVLDPAQTTGTIVTQDKAYENAPGLDWELRLIAYRRANGETFLLEFSTNAGATWHPVSLTEATPLGVGFDGTIPARLLPTSGQVRFRLTMTRVSINDLTPAFEVVRVRRTYAERENKLTAKRRPDHVPGSILVLRPWTQEQDSLEPGRGVLIDHQADQTWTAPLDFFDTTLAHDTPACRIADTLGPHPFYIFAAGAQLGTRYAITKVNLSEQLGIFTHQYLPDRRTQEGENYGLVW